MSVLSGLVTNRRGRSDSISSGRPGPQSYGQDKHNGDASHSVMSPVRTALRNIDSRWFMIPQGTGILAVVLWELAYQFHGLNIIAIVFWVVTIGQFLVILVLYILRAAIFPHHLLSQLSTNNTEVACLASIVVTFTSIVQMLGFLLGNNGWGIAIYVLWWVCAGFSLLAVISIPYVFAQVNPPTLAALLPNTQLPLVAALTAAATGGSLCTGGYWSPELQVPVILVSYLLVGTAIPLAFILDALFLGRLYNQTKDDKAQESKSQALNLAYQSMVLAGPWGQGSSALQGLGKAVLDGSFSQYNSGIMLTSEAAPVVGYSSIFTGIFFWGSATFWWAFTIIGIFQVAMVNPNRRGPAEFGLAAWSMVFPWGVYAHATELLARMFGSPAFRVWSGILTVIMVMVWLVNTVLTMKGCLKGSLFGLGHGWKQRS